jgi:hypothetical protein
LHLQPPQPAHGGTPAGQAAPPPSDGRNGKAPDAHRESPEACHLEHTPAVGHLEPLCVGREQLAALLSISLASLDRWDSSGLLGPVGIKKAGRKLWALAEVREWVSLGMPRRPEWQARRAAERRR